MRRIERGILNTICHSSRLLKIVTKKSIVREESDVKMILYVSFRVVCLIIPAYDWNTSIKTRYTPRTISDCFNALGTSKGLTSKLYLKMYATKNEAHTTDRSIPRTVHRGRECLWKKLNSLFLNEFNIKD
jgi:hypothetical protein